MGEKINCLKVNSGVLYTHHKQFYTALLAAQEEPPRYALTIASEAARDGSLVLLAKRGDSIYRFNSAYRPLQEAEKWASQYTLRDKRIVVSMFGFGNGYFVRELIKKLKTGDRLIVVEPSKELFFHVLANYDVSDIFSHPAVYPVVMGVNTPELYEYLGNFVHWSNAEVQVFCDHPQYDKAFLEDHAQFYEAIRRNNERAYVDRNTELYFGRSMVENTLKNLTKLAQMNTLAQLKGKFPSNAAAVIISAGPSLDKNINALKNAKGRAVLIAVDAALPALLRAGITPDFAVTVDAEKSLACFSAAESKALPLFCEIQSTHDILREQTGRLILFHCHPYANELFARMGRPIPCPPSGGSVATAAFSICTWLGFQTIILVGQDLAYGDGVSHAGGEVHTIIDEDVGICYLEGVDGQPVKSRHDWQAYLKWFEEAIRKLEGSCTVIDATEGGARIQGTQLLRLVDAIAAYCTVPVDCAAVLADCPCGVLEQKRAEVKAFLAESCSDLQAISRRSAEMAAACGAAAAQYERTGIVTEELRQLRRTLNEWNQWVGERPAYALVDACIKEVTVAMLSESCLYREEAEEWLQTLRSAAEIHAAAAASAKELLPRIEEIALYFEEAALEKLCAMPPTEEAAQQELRDWLTKLLLLLRQEETRLRLLGTVEREERLQALTAQLAALDTALAARGKQDVVRAARGEAKNIAELGAIGADSAQTANGEWNTATGRSMQERETAEVQTAHGEAKLAAGRGTQGGQPLFYPQLGGLLLADFLAVQAEQPEPLLALIDRARTEPRFTKENQYFLWYQLFHRLILRPEQETAEMRLALRRWYAEIVGAYAVAYQEKLAAARAWYEGASACEVRTAAERKTVLVTVSQFLSASHPPTRTTLERCHVLTRLGYRVVICNTCELMPALGGVPLYRCKQANRMTDYDIAEVYTDSGQSYPFYQIKSDGADEAALDYLLRLLYRENPALILNIAGGSVLTDLVSGFVKTLSIATHFSELPYVRTQAMVKDILQRPVYCMIGRRLSEEARAEAADWGFSERQILEGIFTFALREPRETLTRAQFAIPEDAFVLAVVGSRLDADVSGAFIEALEPVYQWNCFFAFAGEMERYEQLCRQYPDLKRRSVYTGFLEDIPAFYGLCDLYVNPMRAGGGFSVIEAFAAGLPAVTTAFGDVAVAAGTAFCVPTYAEMVAQIGRYATDSAFYAEQQEKAHLRAVEMTDGEGALRRVLEQLSVLP